MKIIFLLFLFIYVNARYIYIDPEFEAFYNMLNQQNDNVSQSCTFLWETHPRYFDDYRLIAFRKDNVEKMLNCTVQNCTECSNFEKISFYKSMFIYIYEHEGISFPQVCLIELNFLIRITGYFAHYCPFLLNFQPNIQNDNYNVEKDDL